MDEEELIERYSARARTRLDAFVDAYGSANLGHLIVYAETGFPVTSKTLDVETRRAAKRHDCIYCDRPIKGGQSYVRIALVKYEDEGEKFLAVKFHRDREDCGAKR